ncbi:hypothetical protein [Nonomuraea sp. NPDC049709]
MANTPEPVERERRAAALQAVELAAAETATAARLPPRSSRTSESSG